MAEPVLRTSDLTKKYGEFASLDCVSLSVNRGEIYGLVGRNGAGKTTLFKCIMGLARPTSGQIEIEGIQGNLATARHHMGFMISPSFFPYLGPSQNLEYLRKVKGMTGKADIGQVLELVGLGEVKKPFRAFSLGMKQRLGIAGALLGSPSILVLDEPINGLDPQGIIDIRNVIKNVHATTGATMIISSHILGELDLVATHFGFIEQGHLLREVSHAALHEQTRKTLRIEVDDVGLARTLLRDLGADVDIDGQALVLRTHLDQSHEIARALVHAGVEVRDLHRQETTLEEYFVRLVGGHDA